MNEILELFGRSTSNLDQDWEQIISEQQCPFLRRKCIKVRKSQPEISIGSCSVSYGKDQHPIIICPFRLLERRQIFTDCLHLLSSHEPGNELHIVPEVSLPGGSVDYFLTSIRGNKVLDFVGIELQALDTTGTVWPARQSFLKTVGLLKGENPEDKSYGMNWKMTAKTTLIQLHHKIQTFEAIHKHLVLVIQDLFHIYLHKEFQFSHLVEARERDPMHIHAYHVRTEDDDTYRLDLAGRLSTDAAGIAICLGLQAEPRIEITRILDQLYAKISDETRFEL